MDAITNSLNQILERLKGTSVSQRIALFLGGVLVAVSLFWLATWAASPEMIPLLSQDLAQDELGRITRVLDTTGQSYKTSGSRILVSPSANLAALRAQLAQQGALPESTATSFEALIKDSSPWISQSESDRRWGLAMKGHLERILAQFEGVQTANVVLPVSGGRHSFSRNPETQTASIQLIMKNGQPLTREIALAAAKMVCGAVRGLTLRNIQVTDATGAGVLDSDEDSESSGPMHRERQRQEKLIAEKIRAQLADRLARVSVQVEMDMTARHLVTNTPIEGVESRVDTVETSTSRARHSGAPGVEANVAITAGSGGGTDDTSKSTTEKRELRTGVAEKTEETRPGMITQISAAINISHSYLLTIIQRTSPEKTSPTNEELVAVFEAEKKRLIDLVVKLVKPQKPENVAISWYYDAAPAMPVSQAGSLDDTLNIARQYGPQAGLGLLALVSLTLMMRMAKKSNAADSLGIELGLPKEAIAAARKAAQSGGGGSRASGGARGPRRGRDEPEEEADEHLVDSVRISAVGQAAVTEGVLVAQEVDERAVQSHKMVDQIVQMVEQDPDALSGLFEQWIRRQEAGG